ncbi:shikimate kinase [Bacillus sp. FJAT-47783]|uniref:shikimate kinase n=1 Tax=Bacillus sp. FJAT-47783 TaxID=2922712 RepID=UPI001FAE4424|nr:shikimate kinase [Bacillus sp. FJAT-47783]
MKAIYLTGFMGSGKTTIGQLLGKYLNVPVIDTDQEIVRLMGQSIPTIFQKHGEAYFRKLETECLQKLPTENVIVTTGGGIVVNKENRNWMKDHGIFIYLQCDLSILFSRIEQDENRPLANQKTKHELAELFAKRKSFYEEAHVHIATTNLTPIEVVEKINQCIHEYKMGDNNK